MKLIAIGTLGYVLAQMVAPAIGDYGPIAQLGAVGVMAWLTRGLLTELRDARNDSAKQREEHQEAFQAASAQWHADSAAMQKTMLTMVETCSSSRREAFDQDARRDMGRMHSKPKE